MAENPAEDESIGYVESADTVDKEPPLPIEGIGPRGPVRRRPEELPERRPDSTIWMVAAVGIPLITVWLMMGSIIIWRAANDKDVLENIEGLLTALAVLTIPATQFIQGVLRKWNGGD
jgi:hypothetical protein